MKCLHGLAHAYLVIEFSFSYEYRQYNIRNKDLPLSKTTKYLGSFRPNDVKTWKSLASHVRTVTRLLSTSFKKAAKYLEFFSLVTILMMKE